MQETTPSVLTPLPQSQPPRVPKPRLDPARVMECEVLHYPWDDWERWALSRGLEPGVAGQARLLIREWFNHAWDPSLRRICGWSDDGRALFERARRSPKRALAQWDILMRTDGLRGDYHPRTKEWTWGYLASDAERLLFTLTR